MCQNYQALWHIPVFLAFENLKKEDHELKVFLGYTGRPSLKKQNKQHEQQQQNGHKTSSGERTVFSRNSVIKLDSQMQKKETRPIFLTSYKNQFAKH
jgi:hypothetical protein